MERGIRELNKNEAESTEASRELDFIVFLRIYPRFSSDGRN